MILFMFQYKCVNMSSNVISLNASEHLGQLDYGITRVFPIKDPILVGVRLVFLYIGAPRSCSLRNHPRMSDCVLVFFFQYCY